MNNSFNFMKPEMLKSASMEIEHNESVSAYRRFDTEHYVSLDKRTEV